MVVAAVVVVPAVAAAEEAALTTLVLEVVAIGVMASVTLTPATLPPLGVLILLVLPTAAAASHRRRSLSTLRVQYLVSTLWLCGGRYSESSVLGSSRSAIISSAPSTYTMSLPNIGPYNARSMFAIGTAPNPIASQCL